MVARRIAVIVSTLAVSVAARAAGSPPVAPRVPVVDDYYGTKVTDDYRWMEDRHAPKFEQWCREQARYARSVLDRIPGRDSLQVRIAAHTGGGTVASQVHLAGARCSTSSASLGRTHSNSSSALEWTAPRACWSIPIARLLPDITSRSTTSSHRRTGHESHTESPPEARRRASSTSSTSLPDTSGRRSSIAPTMAAPRGETMIAPSTTTASPGSGRTPRIRSST